MNDGTPHAKLHPKDFALLLQVLLNQTDIAMMLKYLADMQVRPDGNRTIYEKIHQKALGVISATRTLCSTRGEADARNPQADSWP